MTILLRGALGHLEENDVVVLQIIFLGIARRGPDSAVFAIPVQLSVAPDSTSKREENGVPVGADHLISFHAVAGGKLPGAFQDQFFHFPVGRCAPAPTPRHLEPEGDVIAICLGDICPDIPVRPEYAETQVYDACIRDTERWGSRACGRIHGRDIDPLAILSRPEKPGVSLNEDHHLIANIPKIQNPAIGAHKDTGFYHIAETAQPGVRIRPFHLLKGQYPGDGVIDTDFQIIGAGARQPAHPAGLHGDQGKGKMALPRCVYFGIGNAHPARLRAEDLVSISPRQSAQVHFIGLKKIGPGVGGTNQLSTQRQQDN